MREHVVDRVHLPEWLVAVALGLTCCGMVLVVWLLMGAADLPSRFLPPELVLTFGLGLTRARGFQRWIGGGHLENRVALRLVLGNVLATFAIVPLGMSFLVPVCIALLAAPHLQRSGARTWPLAAALAVPFTLLAHGLVQTSPYDRPLTTDLATIAMLISLLASIVMIATMGTLTAAAEAAAGELARAQAGTVAELHHAATHDPLTGLLNRQGITALLQDAVPGVRSGEGGAVSTGVLFMDLNGFKAVNDTHGHATGDQLLVAVADRLRLALRPADHIARMGGDEFVALLTDLADPSALHAAADRVADALRRPFDLPEAAVTISVSVGTAVRADGDTSPQAMLDEADAAMYRVKQRHHAAADAAVAVRR